MPSYRVTYQIEVDRETPLEAARQVDDYMQRGIRCFEPIFFITDTDSLETFTIDLEDYREPEA
jgi:hypothetical protein